MKTRLLIAAIALAFAGTVSSSHYHSWSKENETVGTNAWGQQVKICTWKCSTDWQNPHYTQTQGAAYCPQPRIR